MPLVTRQGKGSRLTIQEMDDNLLYLEELAQTAASGNFEEITYSELATKIGDSELVVGRYYKITDFKSCYDQPNFNFYGDSITTGNYKEAEISPIIVLAIATDKLHAQAFQPEFPSDIIKYDVLFDTTEITSGVALGRITERIDEFNNRTDYDHRFIEFRRYTLYYYDAKNQQKTGTIQIDSTTLVDNYYTATVIGTGTSFTTDVTVNDIIAIPNMNNSNINLQFCKVTSITSDTEMAIEGYYLSNVSPLTKWYGTNSYSNMSYKMNNIVGDEVNFGEFTLFGDIEGVADFYNNYYGNTYNLGYEFNLSNNVVLAGPFSNNTFKDGCRNNSFDDDMVENNIGYDFRNNSITNDFDENIIGNDFYDNVIIQDFQNNTIGSDFYNNLITGEFRDNHIGEEFYHNMISTDSSDGFWRNQVGNQFHNNIMITYDEFQNNVIGNGFNNNEIYNSFYKNRIGVGFNNNNIFQEFVDNVIGNGFNNNNTYFSFESNDIDNYFETNTIYAYFNDNIIGEGFYSNSLGSSTNTINFYNNTIKNNSGNNTIGVNFEKNSIENDFLTNSILKDTSNNGEFLRNKLGNNFISNAIYAYFNDNTIGEGFDNNDLGTNSNSITFDRNSIKNTFENNTIIVNFEENSIENDFKGNGIAKDLSDNGSFLRNQIGNDFTANLINANFRDNEIKNGFLINDINGDFDFNNIGNSFDSNVTAQSFSYNEIGHGFFNNNIAEGFGFGGGTQRGNKIGNNFASNTIGEYFYDNTIIDGFTNNTVPNYFQYNQVLTNIGSVDFDTEAGVKAITFSTPNASSDGTYGPISATGGTGLDATFTVTVSGGVVTDVVVSNVGKDYTVSDSLTISSGGFTGASDITVTVTQICSNPMVVGAYNCTILRDVSGYNKLTALDSDGTLYVAPSITSEYI